VIMVDVVVFFAVFEAWSWACISMMLSVRVGLCLLAWEEKDRVLDRSRFKEVRGIMAFNQSRSLVI